MPFRNADAYADPEILKIARFIPVVEAAIDPLNYFLRSRGIRVRQKNSALLNVLG